MPKWTEYTSKETLADNDEVMLYDATARANKRGLMSKFWDYVVDKMATAVISKLETENKTVIGAINALKSNGFLPGEEMKVSADNIEQGAYRVDGSFPIEDEENAILLCFKIFENDQKVIVQFLIPYHCNYIKIRTHWYTHWEDWKIYNVSV